jgi:subtilisin family serine protease
LRQAAIFLVPILVATGSFAAPVAASGPNQIRVDVGYTEGADVDALLASVRSTIRSKRMIENLNVVSFTIDGDWSTWVDEELEKRPDVRYAEEGGTVLGLSDPADQANAGSLARNGIPAAREAANGGEGVVVAVLDTEVTPNSDLGADRLVQGQDFVGYAEGAPKQPGLHGTLVANLIAASENNVGITGVCPKCEIMPVRVLRDVGADNAAGFTSDVAAGIAWAADQGADVINLSLSSDTKS